MTAFEAPFSHYYDHYSSGGNVWLIATLDKWITVIIHCVCQFTSWVMIALFIQVEGKHGEQDLFDKLWEKRPWVAHVTPTQVSIFYETNKLLIFISIITHHLHPIGRPEYTSKEASSVQGAMETAWRRSCISKGERTHSQVPISSPAKWLSFCLAVGSHRGIFDNSLPLRISLLTLVKLDCIEIYRELSCHKMKCYQCRSTACEWG